MVGSPGATPRTGRLHNRRSAWSVVAVLAVIGTVLVLVAVVSQKHAPQPPPEAAGVSAPGTAGVAPGLAPAPGSGSRQVLLLPHSAPVALDVPAIGARSDLLTLGLNPDNTVAVPPQGPVSQAGWYTESPTPGEIGPAVLLGHIDSARYGPGVFFELGALRPGDAVEVTRADHTVAVFRVDRVVSYPKSGFPSLAVYGNTPDAQLRLITCGGVFDPEARSYENNIVVYATLNSVRSQ